ncbi:ferredoxin [Microbacterium sp. RD1]|uniref:ferredoxin n=1 Tax=Microbacterium sp. RD1 TaxID=3457313 RepID=UPI003FA55432
MDIDVNLGACEGHGLCFQVAPSVYEIDHEGYVRLRVAVISRDLEDAAAAGARACPVAALKVVAPRIDRPESSQKEHNHDER